MNGKVAERIARLAKSYFPVAALYVEVDSVYKSMPAVDCYDVLRDARTYCGHFPIVAHPPCRLWGQMSHMSTADESEKELAIHAVELCKRNGGVVEHPLGSALWKSMRLPLPGHPADEWGGFTIDVQQVWWGHVCQKPTRLYIVGIARTDVPPFPRAPGPATRCVARDIKKPGGRRLKHCTKRQRSATPPKFAKWLVTVARMCEKKELAGVPGTGSGLG
jgi:hypothetical protein